MSGGWSPIVHLYSHCGGKLNWDDEAAMFRPAPERGAPIGADGQINTVCAGASNGHMSAKDGLADAIDVARAAAKDLGLKVGRKAAAAKVEEPGQGALKPLWFAPSQGKYAHGTKHFLDYQNDVTAADVELAAREGYESVEHTKRYTTLGMATDQGKTANTIALAVMADCSGKSIPETGTTIFRPPYSPVAIGAFAGRARGKAFRPTREAPDHQP